MSRWLACTLLASSCGLLFFHGLAAGPLYKTEGLRALVAAEMLRDGHWLVPTLCGEPLLTKPPLGYLAIVLASLPFGAVHPWTARLPSAIAATVVVVLLYRLFRRPLGRSAGVVAALTLPASVLWLDRVPSADLDMLQVAWVAGSLVCLQRVLEDAETPMPTAQYRWWVLALLCVASGVLTKWTAPAFFYLTAVPLLWWRGRLSLLWRAPHLLAASLGAILCLAWAGFVVAEVGWQDFRDTVGREALTKLVPGHRSMPYPWNEVVLHPLSLLAAELPWSAVALVTLWPGFARVLEEPGRRLWQLLHCWAWPNLLFWSLVPVHTPRHSLPLVPALGGLSALVWIVWLRGSLRWPLAVSPRWTLALLLGLWVGVKLVFVQAIVPARNHARHPDAKADALVALIPPGEPLHIYRLKDETLLFYTGRVLRRIDLAEGLQQTPELLYCILTEAEWHGWPKARPAEVVGQLADTQGTPLVVVRVGPISHGGLP
jgi:4-amino-4-deoxy-L-arabinose transferase-like glycosyltransferase